MDFNCGQIHWFAATDIDMAVLINLMFEQHFLLNQNKILIEKNKNNEMIYEQFYIENHIN